MFASLDKEAPPKEVYSKKEETFSHRIATSILYDLNLRFGGKIENGRIAFLTEYHFPLDSFSCLKP